MYRVYDITSSAAERPEALGSKEKFWLRPDPALDLPPELHLFKIGRPGTGENWSEKAACEIAKIIGMPCAEYNLAICDGTQGVISKRIYPDGGAFIPANVILSRLDASYDGALRFKQVRYKLSAAMEFLAHAPLDAPIGFEQVYPNISASDYFVGYLLLDALIGNTDRHHENWGIVITEQEDMTTYHLAATFDHASSLGRELSDERREERLTTQDTRANLAAYASRSRSAFYGAGPRPRLLTNPEVVATLVTQHPNSTKFWAKKIAGISSQSFENVFSRISNQFISNKAAEFAIRFLTFNQARIKEIADAS